MPHAVLIRIVTRNRLFGASYNSQACFSLLHSQEDNAAVKKRVYDMQLELENDMMGVCIGCIPI